MDANVKSADGQWRVEACVYRGTMNCTHAVGDERLGISVGSVLG